jgi:hypothetical protein
LKTLLIISPCFLLVQTCSLQNTENSSATKKDTIKQEINRIDPIAIGFDKEIKPIFIKNCSPCHFAGGKMYEKLPFDKETTIINHSAAILKRIKNEEENTLLSNFISQNKNGPSEDKPHK